ncbi:MULTISPECIES: zf-HC2 domain-containing protein [unclassified Nocardiopsis]|uniref:zf-HC2 domain-containing protein n=1 Tax=unclassified Nocardiopsis TaxID=2649073 RepID=UPI00135ABDCB|nr:MULTISPECIES: zf-HC2 domain-containing protein [unclassified Nocardiopsis]
MSWHLTPAQAHEYAHHRSDDVTAMSVEAHITRCAPCRDLLPDDEAWLARSWADLRDVVDRPRRGPVEFLLSRLGVGEGTAKLLAATPGLYRAWLLATVVVLAAALLAAHHLPRGSLMFAFTAPVVPLVGVALAYGRGVDPAHALTSVTPLSGQRLLFLRTSAVLVPALTLCTAAALLLPSARTPWSAVFWLLPALTLVAGSLVLSRWLPLGAASTVVGTLWLTALGALTASGGTEPLQLLAPQAQAWWAGALIALVCAIAWRVRTA